MAEHVRRIAMLLPSLHVGGAEKLVLEELSVLKDDARFAVELHLVFDEGPFFRSAASLGIPVCVWNAPHKSVRVFATYAAIARQLRRTRCDILHSHLLDWIGPLVGKLAGVKTVSTVHSDASYTLMEKKSLAASDLVLACGDQVLKNIRMFIPAEKTRVLNNAIRRPGPISCGREAVLRKYGLPKDCRFVVSLGRLNRQKGYDLLIKAFHRVLPHAPGAVLLIGGEGAERTSLQELIAALKLRQSVLIPGLLGDVREVLAACELYVNSSRQEGLPMSLLEAMALGKPLVATNVGGNPEVTRDNLTGILIPPEDPERLAAAILRMLKDDAFRVRAGQEALRLFESRYTIEKHGEALARYYLSVLDGPAPAAGAVRGDSGGLRRECVR